MNFPSSFYSWDLLSEAVAIKHLDKSAFLHHGTGIPKEIITFFDLAENSAEIRKTIHLQVENEVLEAQIQLDAVLSRYRLFWKSNFSILLKQRFSLYYDLYSAHKEVVGERPKLKLSRVRTDLFKVEFIEPAEKPGAIDANSSDWTDLEFESAVDAYFLMLYKEQRGESYNKAEINQHLRDSDLSNRSKGSIEFRMQNISAVLQV